MSASLRESFLADQAGLRARHAALIAPGGRERRGVIAVVGGAALVFLAGCIWLNLLPLIIIHGMARLLDLTTLMWPPLPADMDRVELYLSALGETVAIAFLGTLGAMVLAVPFGFLAARNVVARLVLHLLTRRVLDTIRSVDTLIWALIWINVVGLGPFAGALAIMSSDFGALGKLMSEAIETADRKPVEGIMATGGSKFFAIRFGIVPQVLPVFASQFLYFFESNTRSSTILGIVGAGGIGLHLSEMIRTLELKDVAFIIILVLITVALIDVMSTRLRRAIAGRPKMALA